MLFDKYNKQTEMMFYYMKGEAKAKAINFVALDKFLRNIELNSTDVQRLEEHHPD